MNGYVDELRDQVVDAARRQHRARRRRRAVVASIAGGVAIGGAIAVVVGVLLAPSNTPLAAEASVRITRVEERTLVEILEPGHPDDVVADLRAMGLVVERVERRTGPSRVGQVVGIAVEGSTAPASNVNGLFSAYVEGRSKVQIGVGVPAPPGELYDVVTDAFAAGEPLECISWPGQPVAQLAAAVRDRAVDFAFIDHRSGPVDELPADGVVVSAAAGSSDRVLVTVGDGAPAPAPPECSTPTATG